MNASFFGMAWNQQTDPDETSTTLPASFVLRRQKKLLKAHLFQFVFGMRETGPQATNLNFNKLFQPS